jgi:hypothetical protein
VPTHNNSAKPVKPNFSQKKSIIETFQNLFKSNSHHSNKKSIAATNRADLNKSKNNTVELINFQRTQKELHCFNQLNSK